MKHYVAEQWIDFVNDTVPGTKREEMQKHLESGCKQCNKAAALWQKVREFSGEEGNFRPGVETVRAVKAAFGTVQRERKLGPGATLVELLFDSFQQPVAAGARSGSMSSRQMLFQADPYQIDVKIETKPGSAHLLVTGQVLHVSKPDSIAQGIPINLSNRRGQTIQTTTNAHGEFLGELENRGELELSFRGPDSKPIVISLADALGQLFSVTRGEGKHSLRK